MPLSRDQLRRLEIAGADYAVSADGALAFVQASRKQGGAASLLGSGLLVTIVAMSSMLAVFYLPLVLIALAATVPLVPLLRRGLRSNEVARQLARAARLPRPLEARLFDHVLLLGTAETPLQTWCSIPVTRLQEHHVRTLALPTARLHRD